MVGSLGAGVGVAVAGAKVGSSGIAVGVVTASSSPQAASANAKKITRAGVNIVLSFISGFLFTI
jgi:hypothetical protein